MHGMIDMVRNGEFPEGCAVCCMRTLGGVPALERATALFSATAE